MKNLSIKLSLFFNYFVFAILLNCVGTVMLQMQRNFGISKSAVSILEGFKDLPIAIAAFIFASFLPKIGLKKAMLIALGLVTIICSFIPLADDFWYFKLLFLVIGVSFALIKISVFSTIGLLTNNEKEHSSFMNFIEAVFMSGVMLGGFIFSLFVNNTDSSSRAWMQIYWIIAALSALAFVLLFFSKLDETAAKIENTSFKNDFNNMIALIVKVLVLVFILSIFFYVMIEQSFSTWMPTFYKEILHASPSLAIQAGSVLAGATFLGRLLSGFILLRVKWIHYLSFCLVAIGTIVLIVMPLATNLLIENPDQMTWINAPYVLYLLPLMGLFLAPIYPTLNSIILSSLPKHTHSAMSGLIVVFSALGGTIGSMITGHVFDAFGGTTAFYFALIPVIMILILIWTLNNLLNKKQTKTA
jgi:fucose permease